MANSRLGWHVAAWLVSCVFGPSCVMAATVFVSPSGADLNDGASPERPVKTVARAMQLANRGLDSETVTVHFLPGQYGAQIVEVTKFPKAGSRLVLDGGADPTGHAEFDGGGGGTTWLLVRGQAGTTSNVTVRGFIVRNFRGAIQFFGDRFDARQWSGGNVIELNRFEDIGQHTKGIEPSFAAIGLTNSRDNRIAGNTFVNIANIDKCDGLHAIYMAGGASNNEIVDNVFRGGCGDTIKVRDRSNFNKVERNSFEHQSGHSLFVDSFCDSRKQADCRRDKQECPSWGNVFRGNRVDQASRSAVKYIQRHVGASDIPACPLPPGGASAPRIVADN
ncbi:hypothetical protein [Ideonella sp. YS5]|uniref:hypothetical protein n=1 Tax=Ideonella sp. YS5 TaxID=3453714 RepID=UPI003EEC46A1